MDSTRLAYSSRDEWPKGLAEITVGCYLLLWALYSLARVALSLEPSIAFLLEGSAPAVLLGIPLLTFVYRLRRDRRFTTALEHNSRPAGPNLPWAFAATILPFAIFWLWPSPIGLTLALTGGLVAAGVLAGARHLYVAVAGLLVSFAGISAIHPAQEVAVAALWGGMGLSLVAVGTWVAIRTGGSKASSGSLEESTVEDPATPDTIQQIIATLNNVPIINEEDAAGDFRAITQLDRLVHEPGRLAILAILWSRPTADFKSLARDTGLTEGNLNAHLTKLHTAGLLRVRKGFRGKTPFTVYALSPPGDAAFQTYWEVLGQVAYRVEHDRRQRLALGSPR